MSKNFPIALARRLRDEYQLQYFVETGTHVGHTIRLVSGEFKRIISLEISPEYVQLARETCKGQANVTIFQADSSKWLLEALALLSEPALIWLDAHWGPDLGYSRPKLGECPVMAELAQIAQDGRAHVVMIDDARLFLGTPPAPHNPRQWPTFAALESGWLQSSHDIYIEEDVIVLTPQRQA